MSVGGRIEKMLVTDSLQNGDFLLLQMPLFVGWTTVNNILNPTRGISIGYNLAPSINFERFGRWYLEQKLTVGNYLSVSKRDYLVLAQQITFGSILSQRLHDIPIPERFLGGSEDDLRGYTYLSVSPLRRNSHGKRKPLGGRSAIYYTAETRFRLTENFGLVPFFDLGNVWLEQIPVFHGKWLKSVGIGARYFTFIGPLRCDIGFPLNRRHGIDHKWRVLVSIGQSF
jgi:translocation and assembly module TamA